MSKDLFYYPFYPKQWAIKTNILTLEEKGAYLEIINAIYITLSFNYNTFIYNELIIKKIYYLPS